MIERTLLIRPLRLGARTGAITAMLVGLGLLVVGSLSCSRNGEPSANAARPNVLWVVWDTVRADRMSVYGHARPTTPFLERWAKDARVFEDCVATAGSTVPSHASMFTGLLPTEHGANYSEQALSDGLTTVAELFRDSGYDTFLFAANPHIQSTTNFSQGFEVEKHPWSEEYRDEATSIVRGKIPRGDQSSHLVKKMQNEEAEVGDWNLMASGQLAETALLNWLENRDESKPYFAFLNYMEAHAPYIPPRAYREMLLDSEKDVADSYALDNRAVSRWAYCFNLYEYSARDLDLMSRVYDASLIELDALFEGLLARLEAEGLLDDTVVVLVSDHGEQLGEHHLIDHQYALYDAMLRVPLIVHYPARFAAGRDDAPVATFDLFPTLLELAGIDPPEGLESKAVSLLAPAEGRVRLAEYPTPFEQGFRKVLRFHPDFDPSPWSRRLRAFYRGDQKLICSTDGRHELYDRKADPGEEVDLSAQQAALGDELMRDLLAFSATLGSPRDADAAEFSQQELEMLRALGYVGDEEDAEELNLEVDDSATCGFE
jgi:arylsulfatase A-like enzyme